jgi:hypothetical protein
LFRRTFGGGDDAASISLGDRQAALAAALRWLSEGYTGVKIIGDARIYTPAELAKVVGDFGGLGD